MQHKILAYFFKGLMLVLGLNIISIAAVNGQHQKFSLSAGGALYVNNMTWSIAGNLQGESPNILSELDFKNITSLGFYLNGSYSPIRYLQLKVFYQRNEVFDGKGTDIDYAGDNRTNPTFNQSFSSNDGHLEIFKVGAQYMFLHGNRFALRAGIAYKNTLQNFVMLSPELTDLRSVYWARWRGPNISIEGKYHISNPFSISADFSYSFIRYSAKANWNLINIFEHPLSFAQNAKGRGTEFNAYCRYAINGFLSLSFGGRLGSAHVYKGFDVSYLKNGTQLSTQFNGSVNKYSGIYLGANYMF